MKLCFSTLGCTESSLEEVIALAKSFGINALEIRGLSGELDNEKIAYFAKDESEKTKAALKEAGVFPLVLGTSCAFHNEETYDAAIKEGYTAIEIAARLGFSAIRVFGDRIEGKETECISRVAKGVHTLCRYAEDFGTNVYLEVHGDFVTEERLAPIVTCCEGCPCFGLIWDVCHTRKSYPDPRVFYDRFKDAIRHVHLKDIKGDTHVLPGEGTLSLRDIADYMLLQGYAGYFSLEWEKKWHPELPPLKTALERYVQLMRHPL